MSRDNKYKPVGTSIVTIPLDPELHRRLRIHCASEGRTVKWVGTEAIRRYLDMQDKMAELKIVEG